MYLVAIVLSLLHTQLQTPYLNNMAHHKLTDKEKFEQPNKESIDLWDKVFTILNDLEDKIKKLENKTK